MLCAMKIGVWCGMNMRNRLTKEDMGEAGGVFG